MHSPLSTTLPALLVAAAYHAERHNVAETILTSWIVTEELLSNRWDAYADNLGDAERRRQLRDYRTYTAGVQIEVLHTAGEMSADTAGKVNAARKIRNDLAHRAAMSQQAAAECLEAMRVMLGDLGVAPNRLPGWSFQGGGIGTPVRELEPGFPFR